MPRIQAAIKLIGNLSVHLRYIKYYIGLLALDVVTKILATTYLLKWADGLETTLYQGSRLELLKIGHPRGRFFFDLKLNYVRNEAAAFNLFLTLSETVRDFLFLSLFVVVVLPVFYLLTLRYQKSALALFGLGITVLGAVGNTIDRMVYGYVIDFISMRGRIFDQSLSLPAFNIADTYIVIGLIMVAVGEYRVGLSQIKIANKRD